MVFSTHNPAVQPSKIYGCLSVPNLRTPAKGAKMLFKQLFSAEFLRSKRFIHGLTLWRLAKAGKFSTNLHLMHKA
jgi:hypothetical protein